MNIFWLDIDLEKSANALYKTHVTKMPLESTQILCSVLYRLGIKDSRLYRPTHINHPCVVWAASSMQNYMLMHEYTRELFNEFYSRRRKQHASKAMLKIIDEYNLDSNMFPNNGLSLPPLVMPEEYRFDAVDFFDVVTAYRKMYSQHKRNLYDYENVPPPSWNK